MSMHRLRWSVEVRWKWSRLQKRVRWSWSQDRFTKPTTSWDEK